MKQKINKKKTKQNKIKKRLEDNNNNEIRTKIFLN